MRDRCSATVAGVATDLWISFESGLVDASHHGDHLTSRLLLALFVRSKIPVAVLIDVTIRAVNSKGSAHVIHHWDKLRLGYTFEHLNVFVDLVDCFFWRRLAWTRLNLLSACVTNNQNT